MPRWAEQSISKTVLGGTLTSQADGKTSTNALGKVHDDVRMDLMQADARQIASTLTRQLVWPLVALNTRNPDPMRSPVFRFDFRQPGDLEKFSAALPGLVQSGVQIPVRWVYESLGIPVPVEGDEILGLGRGSAAMTMSHGRVEGCSHCAALKASGVPVALDLADRYASKGVELAGPAMEAMVDPVLQLLARASSLEEFRDSLFACFPDMNSAAMEAILAQSMLAANLGGRVEVLDGQ